MVFLWSLFTQLHIGIFLLQVFFFFLPGLKAVTEDVSDLW